MKYIINQNMLDKRIVIYGIGHLFEKHKEILNWDNIVSIVDMDIDKQRNSFNGKKVESPDTICTLSYDYIVIFTNQYFEDAKINLIGNYFIPQQKIVSWRIFYEDDEIATDERAQFYKEYIENREARTVLDVGEQKFRRYFFSSDQLKFTVSSLGACKFQLYNSFYENIIHIDNDKKKYDVLLLWGNYIQNMEWESLAYLAKNYIIWTISYSYRVHKNFVSDVERLEHWGEKKTFLFSDAIIYVFEKKKKRKKIDCEIFVVTHKSYNVLSDKLYKPICVGNQYENKKFYSEHTGENISYLNDRINECTALYWIWKNTESEYVGLNHYRRYFYNNGIKNCSDYLTEDKIAEIFDSGFDIIVPRLTKLSASILDNIMNSIGEDLGNRALVIMRGLLKEKVPRYVNAFEYVMAGNVFYKCQMFVTKRGLLDSYCEWLFSFLIDAAKMLDVSLYDTHHKRTIGYFAETMLTVWLLEQNVKIRELLITEL